MKTQLRWLTLLIAVGLFAIGGLFLSDALGRQKRVSRTNAAVVPAAPIYVNGNFTFSPPIALTHAPIPAVSPCPVPSPNPLGLGCPAIKDQDTEPEIKTDIFGNVYVTAIHGYPGGVDLWKSTDKGASFAYLGIPDGTQD